MLLNIKTIIRDWSLSATVSGFIAVLIGFASAMAIVLQAGQAAGASPQILESWIWALGIGMGVGCIGLSAYYKRPIIIVWSTPGAALLATSLMGATIEQATGIFIFVAILSILVGVTGAFQKLTSYIPLPIASALLAGVLFQFGLQIFTSFALNPLLVGIMLSIYLLTKRVLPRYAIVCVFLVGIIITIFQGQLATENLAFELTTPIWVSPEFDINLLIGIGIPLFIVTMTSQNLPGIAVLKASGYEKQSISPILTTVGSINLVLAPFGGFTFNLAAITAAICTSEEAHPDKNKRYIAGIAAGIFNIIAGLLGAAVVALFASFPMAFIAALAGIALLGTIANSLNTAFVEPVYREAALVTFLVSASGISFFEIAASFWGVVFGLIVLAFQRLKH
ncbi:benzoate/H(+) symporter BenE family transporter [Brumicola pallidula]|uniref:Benzoate membrane transport protein n=1 Tax=Brumicola pallidula DSM 14239 = ACAM 615 TaxID=1121922 RepID=K6YBX0_9ALTE|nr:benzoate/H(+) symporter BenE family transporter [Glaciecola pallidula]GAC30239.1 benzoate membrane transport protein [Glaciecola pallidula DSM 14239 = ACAM 615]